MKAGEALQVPKELTSFLVPSTRWGGMPGAEQGRHEQHTAAPGDGGR